MIKLLGAILVFCACVVGGCILPYEMKQRIRLLEQLERDLCHMNAELNTCMPTIPDLLETVAEQSGALTEPVYREVLSCMEKNGPADFAEAWTTCVDSRLPRLTVSERQKLGGLGQILGRYVLADEVAAIGDVLLSVRKGLTETTQAYNDKSKVSVSIGAALGLFLIIALA